MRHCFKIFFMLVIGQYSFAATKGPVIQGTFANSERYKKVYLYEYLGGAMYVKDSTALESGGKFTFHFNKPLPRGFYSLGVNISQYVMLILGEESLSVNGDLNNIRETAKVSDSPENVLFGNFLTMNQMQAQLISKNESEVQKLMQIKASQPDEYNRRLPLLQKSMDSLNAVRTGFIEDIIRNQPNSFMAKVLGLFSFSDTTSKENFFRNNELQDEELSRGDMIQNKLSFYFNRFGGGNPETWKKESLYLLSKTKPGSRSREMLYVALLQLHQQAGAPAPAEMIKSFATEYPSKRTKDFLQTIPKGEPQEGDLAPEMSLNDVNGKPLSLSSLRGKVVLIDFWASWCGPCRMENPNVVRAYEKYKDVGFTVYSVSLDQSKEKWLQAIQKDKLIWPNHVSDLRGWQSAGAALYSVKGIPATFLIDREGKIVGKNLRGIKLEEKLAELLENKK